MTESQRPRFLTLMAILFGILAVSNATKAIQAVVAPPNGVVLFGVRFETVLANAVLGPAMALVLAAYSRGLWTMRRWVLPLSIVYAFFVPTNLVIFWFLRTGPERPPIAGLIVYLFFALGGSIGTALYLCLHRERLT